MNTKQAKTVKIGQRVTWLSQDGMQPTTTQGILASYGTVTEKDYARMMVEWDDGLKCSYRLDDVSNLHQA